MTSRFPSLPGSLMRCLLNIVVIFLSQSHYEYYKENKFTFRELKQRAEAIPNLSGNQQPSFGTLLNNLKQVQMEKQTNLTIYRNNHRGHFLRGTIGLSDCGICLINGFITSAPSLFPVNCCMISSGC